MATGTILKTRLLQSGFNIYHGQITLDSSYPTNGEPIDLALNERIDVMICEQKNGYTFEWDADNQKLKVFRGDNANASPAPGVEVSNAVDLSAVTAIDWIGIGA
jgi:hypothetical protein